jgi:hypothetical protein
MNPETKALIKSRLSVLDGEITKAQEAMEKAKEDKQKAVAIFNTCQEKLFNLNTEKLKLKEDLPNNQ